MIEATANRPAYSSPLVTVDIEVQLPAPYVEGDFTGDGAADIGIYDIQNGGWYFWLDTGVVHVPFPSSYTTNFAGWYPVPGDYLGDGRMDVAIYQPITGTWWIEALGSPILMPGTYASLDSLPAQADYSGDGVTDLALWDASIGTWWMHDLPSGITYEILWPFAQSPISPYIASADYNGDGRVDFSIYDNDQKRWYIIYANSLDAYSGAAPGSQVVVSPASVLTADRSNNEIGEWPVALDYTGNGRADFTFYATESAADPSRGLWRVYGSAQTSPGRIFDIEQAGLIPIPARYTGQAVADIAVYDLLTGTWIIGAGEADEIQFGWPMSIPVASPQGLWIILRLL